MTQRFYSQFVEHYLEYLLSPLGNVALSGLIADEERRGIVLFFSKQATQIEKHSMKLLEKVAQSDCAIVRIKQEGEDLSLVNLSYIV
ncbi:hypothetical protein IQ244_29695 [Nostoc sp. LEGE 06077]|nr:hypothetical protein [Nostoc sp. LEGE 06077]